MPRDELSALRRSQIVGVYGPGAIVDFKGGRRQASVSAVVGGLDAWDQNAFKKGLANEQVIFEPRLQRKLGVNGFRLPPVAPEIAPGVVSKNADDLIGVRFPAWLQCPKCKILRPAQKWKKDPGEPALYCSPCTDLEPGRSSRVFVIPVRFIRICAAGHLDEFPWDYWVDHKSDCKKSGQLKLEHEGGSGLSGFILSCKECGSRRAMEGCFGADDLRQCRGRRPWLPDATEECDQEARVVQRGASNIYYAATDASLDIPPWSDPVQKKLERHWADLAATESNERKMLLKLLKLPEKVGMTLDALAERVDALMEKTEAVDHDEIRWEEYQQFVSHNAEFGQNTEFEIRPVEPPPEHAEWIEKVVVATRLREVRALVGFTRVHPPAGLRDPRIAKISTQHKDWLPGVDNRGEGIFIKLSDQKLADWESRESVKTKVAELDERHREMWIRRNGSEAGRTPVTPRLVLIHSFAHCLIQRLALDCGYASASLRERLYVGQGDMAMAGVLLYTASPDADGTLGGLAAQGHPDYLAGIVEGGLRSLRWCSSDPLCIEGRIAYSHRLNGAACHSCMLLSETSCEHFNFLLDRALLVGTAETPELGYFRELIDSMDDEYQTQ